jgi:hypothetical protein
VCTLTAVPLGDGRTRLAFNRDEQRARTAALPPQVRRYGQRTAVLPIDPVSDGTWVAVNDAGLVLGLLNATETPDSVCHGRPGRMSAHTAGTAVAHAARASRGTIIPALLACDTLAEAVRRSRELSAHDYSPFRLVLARSGAIAEVRSDGRQLFIEEPSPLTAPRLFTSSGLSDELVIRPRQRLFEQFFLAGADWAARQDAFHRHAWPDAPHLSVCMSRPDARTVSLTLVEFTASGGVMTYHPDSPDRPAEPSVKRIAFREVPR